MQDRTVIPERAQWDSAFNYIVVTTGAIVGLGNIIEFPSLIQKFGGIFLLFYLLAELFICVPLFFAELMIGRRGKQNPIGSISIVAMESYASKYWKNIGWLCFIILFFSLSYYIVIASYPFFYLTHAIKLLTLPSTVLNRVGLHFHIKISLFYLFLCFSIFLLIVMTVVMRGINRGLEGISVFLVPLYVVIFLFLAVYSSVMGNFAGALQYLTQFKFNQELLPIVFAAVSFAFFKLNIGMGSMIVYGSYLPYSVSLARSTIIVLLIDIFVSLSVYFCLFPIIFFDKKFGFAETLSYDHIIEIFVHARQPVVMIVPFFFATVIAAFMPSIAMAESATVVLIERFALGRKYAASIIGIAALSLGAFVVWLNTEWASWKFKKILVSSLLPLFTEQILIPVSAILLAIFAGWIIRNEIAKEELEFNRFFYFWWRFLLKFATPLFVLWILVV